MTSKLWLCATLAVFVSACSGDDGSDGTNGEPGAPGEPGTPGQNGSDGQDGEAGTDGEPGQDGTDTTARLGGVYVMTNEVDGNRLVSYATGADGRLEFIGATSTGGLGSDEFDGPEGLDPLISAYAVEKTEDDRFVLVVNAGSNTISSLRVESDFSLTLVDTEDTGGVGPNSIAVSGALVYVSNIDADGVFNGEPDQEGNVSAFIIGADGTLSPVAGSTRSLANRPSAVRFSPDGGHLVVAAINSGSSALASDSQDELVVFDVSANGLLSNAPVAAATSTLRDNAEGRNLPSAIGFEIVEDGNGDPVVVVTEAREFQPDGAPPAFPALQTGSVSTWALGSDGSLTALQLDVLADESGGLDGSRTACWVAFSADNRYFWVSNALEASLSAYSFSADGTIELIDGVAAQGTPATSEDPATAFGETDGWIDLDVSSDGRYLYQLYGLDGTVGVYAIDGSALTLVQEDSGNLPEADTQGIIAVGPPRSVTSAYAGGVYVMTNGLDANRIVSYGRRQNGTLASLGSIATGGVGSDEFDGPEGLDPLISAYAIEKTADNRYVLAVNAGSNTVTSLRVESDFSLSVVDTVDTQGVGPNSIAISGSLVYVSNIDEDGAFAGEPDQEGNLVGFILGVDGSLNPLPASSRSLGNRPSAVRFSPDGQYLVAASINAGSSALATGSEDELVVYEVGEDGLLSDDDIDGATSTLRDNTAGRNLPSAIGFEIVEDAEGRNIVVVTEAREFRPDGSPPAFADLQTGSVSTWVLESDGTLTALALDVLADESGDLDGSRTACWLAFSPDNRYFWVSNALEASLSAFSFAADGAIELVAGIAAQGSPAISDDPATAFSQTDGWIDLDISDDGRFLYQLYGLDGTVGVFAVDGSSLTLIDEVSGDLPEADTQGIVAF